MILVAGATGQVGSEVCRLLREQGQAVRGLARPTSDPAQVAALVEMGAQMVEGDLLRPDSLARVCSGMDAVVSTATAIARQDGDLASVDEAGQQALIDAAAAAGVQHFVYVSVSGGIDVETPLGRAKRAAERRLAQSGMNYTILRPPAFMEVWLSPMLGFDVPSGSVTVYGEGGAPVSYISAFDVAALCVASLHTPAARNALLEVTGPEPVTALQAVRIAESVTGRQLEVRHVPVEALQAQYEGAIDERQKTFAGLMLALARGDARDPREMYAVFPRRLRTVREYLQQAFAPAPQLDVHI